MRILIDRDTCSHHPSGCEQCFGEFLGRGDIRNLPCLMNVQDDGKPEVTAIIKSGTYEGVLVVTEANREEIIYHGWMKFVNMPPQAFDDPSPQRDRARDVQSG